jgi:alpha-galactosidase
LTHPGAYEQVRAQLLALLGANRIAYLKWDHNRLLVEAGRQPGGEAAAHAQTLAVYRLMDELRAAHPGLEIESCASGGGRVDLGILERTQRIWGSDCNDPLERTAINRLTQLLAPPEMVGAHIGPSPSHTTGRSHPLAFRAAAALWCHLGVEQDLTELDAADLAELKGWIAFHKRHRELLHSGTVVNADTDGLAVHGVVAEDQSRALFSVTLLERSMVWPLELIPFPGLAPDRNYRPRLVSPVGLVGRDGGDGGDGGGTGGVHSGGDGGGQSRQSGGQSSLESGQSGQSGGESGQSGQSGQSGGTGGGQGGAGAGPVREGLPPWAAASPAPVMTGRMLEADGLAGLRQWPETAYFVEFAAAD